jgi:RHS repeat-associated protein
LTQSNGNVLSQTITVPTVGQTDGFVATQSFEYDTLNRLQSAEEIIDSQTSWKQVFTFDRYGNRNFDEANTTFAGFEKLCNNNTELCAELRRILNPSINQSNNRLSSSDDYVFDSSGNTTEDAQGRTFIYDAENKQIEVQDSRQNVIGQYHYDGDGKRVKKYVPDTGEVTVFVYSAGGQLVAEYSTEISPDPKVSYTTADQLGSPRILTDENGATISRRDFHPFGEEISTPERTAALGYQPDDVRQKFTSYERDTETDLDYAKARMFGSSVGRFTSPDDFLNDTHVSDPQSWNLYVYVRNNPLRYIDPTGEIQTNPDGTIRFKPNKIDKKTGKPKDSEFIYLTVTGEDGKTSTYKWRAIKGNVFADNGKKITAYKATTPISVEIRDSAGKLDENASKSATENIAKAGHENNNRADCHGQTFTNGELWINNNQVSKIIKNDGYRELTDGETPQSRDIGIYAEGKKFNLKNTQHSILVNTVTNGQVTDVISKGGITTKAILPTGPGPNTAWDSANNQNDKKNTQLRYFTKRVQQ